MINFITSLVALCSAFNYGVSTPNENKQILWDTMTPSDIQHVSVLDVNVEYDIDDNALRFPAQDGIYNEYIFDTVVLSYDQSFDSGTYSYIFGDNTNYTLYTIDFFYTYNNTYQLLIDYSPTTSAIGTYYNVYVSYEVSCVKAGNSTDAWTCRTFRFDIPLWRDLPSSFYGYRLPVEFDFCWITTSIHVVDLQSSPISDYYDNFYYQEHYDIGFAEGYNSGYDRGYENGYATGKNDGYTLGISGSNSFRSLFSTLIDTPIIYLRKLFDYELFGISMFTALATVISLIVALSVFRLVRGIF